MDCNPPGSSVCGILQARILEWEAIPFSRDPSQPSDRIPVSCIAGGFFFHHLSPWGSLKLQRSRTQWEPEGLETCILSPPLPTPFLGLTSVSSPILWESPPPSSEVIRFLCLWNSLGKNTGAGSLSLLQGIFLTQGSNPGLLSLLYYTTVPPGKSHINSFTPHKETKVINTVFISIFLAWKLRLAEMNNRLSVKKESRKKKKKESRKHTQVVLTQEPML